MNGHTAITILIFMLLLMVIVLVWLVDTVSLYSDRLAKLQEENKCLRQMIQEGFLLDNDGMAAFNKMFGTACLHGFGDNGMNGDV